MVDVEIGPKVRNDETRIVAQTGVTLVCLQLPSSRKLYHATKTAIRTIVEYISMIRFLVRRDEGHCRTKLLTFGVEGIRTRKDREWICHAVVKRAI